jgi:hypothetical protein
MCQQHDPGRYERCDRWPNENTETMRAQTGQRSDYCAKMKRVAWGERVPGVTWARYAVAAAMDYDTIRPFTIDETFDQMGKYACESNAAQHLLGWPREVGPPA